MPRRRTGNRRPKRRGTAGSATGTAQIEPSKPNAPEDNKVAQLLHEPAQCFKPLQPPGFRRRHAPQVHPARVLAKTETVQISARQQPRDNLIGQRSTRL
jgi:hypothetical protein